MEEVLKGIYIAVGTILLCIALSLVFKDNRGLNQVLDTQKEIILDKSVIYQEYQEEKDKNVTYQELVAGLLNGIEYPVKVNGVEITPETFEPETFDFALIPQTEYKKTYYYNANNEIKLIQYQSI
ncbi:MAG TPA: hypothetical protein IAC14_05280 [Candidatus Scybalomonas excrementigallinarum]|nr:hypothetical protein [Candidatus Scybalomonas excrementigallinarum]